MYSGKTRLIVALYYRYWRKEEDWYGSVIFPVKFFFVTVGRKVMWCHHYFKTDLCVCVCVPANVATLFSDWWTEGDMETVTERYGSRQEEIRWKEWKGWSNEWQVAGNLRDTGCSILPPPSSSLHYPFTSHHLCGCWPTVAYATRTYVTPGERIKWKYVAYVMYNQTSYTNQAK